MMYIKAFSSISFQPTFRNPGFSAGMSELTGEETAVCPDYSTIIPPMVRRRMSDVMKMSIACTKDCLEQAGLEQPDGIIIGTGIGPGKHTRQFMDKIFEAEDELLAPTSFITSTHNTFAGQISLMLKNHNYNTTHSHSSLSFELSLLDAVMCIEEGNSNVLVGSADERENELFNLAGRLKADNYPIACGASFFILSKEMGNNEGSVKLVDMLIYGRTESLHQVITTFLESNSRMADDIDVVLFSESDGKASEELRRIFKDQTLIDIQKFSGTYLTNSAFGMHYAIDLLMNGKGEFEKEKQGSVLICNNLIPENLGLIFLQK